MKKLLIFGFLFGVNVAMAQQPAMDLTLEQAIEIAQENSPEAQAARHTYRSAYWNYRYRLPTNQSFHALANGTYAKWFLHSEGQ